MGYVIFLKQTAPAAQDAAPEGPAADTAQPAVQDGPDVAQAEQNPDAIAPENWKRETKPTRERALQRWFEWEHPWKENKIECFV